MSATPVPYVSVESSEQVKRNVFCKHYGVCLDHAIERNWQGFSCEECREYEREGMEREQWDEDGFRCTALIYLVLFSKLTHQVGNNNPSFGWKN